MISARRHRVAVDGWRAVVVRLTGDLQQLGERADVQARADAARWLRGIAESHRLDAEHATTAEGRREVHRAVRDHLLDVARDVESLA